MKNKKKRNEDEDSRFKHWREWAILTNSEKVKLYPTLSNKEKNIIWCDDYMKIVAKQVIN